MPSNQELEHIFETADISTSVQEKLGRDGIHSVDDLISAKHQITNGNIKIKKGARTELIDVIKWAEAFKEEHGRRPDFCTEFTDESFQEFQASGKGVSLFFKTQNLLQLYSYGPQIPGTGTGTEMDEMYDQLELNGLLPQLIQSITKKVVDSMTTCLKNACGDFDYENFAQQVVRAVCVKPTLIMNSCEDNSLPSNSKSNDPKIFTGKTFIVAGRTQAGKSSVKGVLLTMCATSKQAPLIVITKGVAESQDLHEDKLQKYAEGTKFQKHIVCASKRHWSKRLEEMETALENCGTIVIADTMSQINTVNRALLKYRKENAKRKFVLVVDECDAMYRTHDRSQKMEKAYDELMEMNPCLRVMISATPIPLFLILRDEVGGTPPSIFQIDPDPDYMGHDDMKPLEVNGENVYLELNELKHATGVSAKVEGVHVTTGSDSEDGTDRDTVMSEEEDDDDDFIIPYTNKSVMQLYEDALSGESKKGVLLLDCTNPRVYVQGNVQQKAERIQEKYAGLGKKVAVLTYTGKCISKRLPGENNWTEYDKGTCIGRVIEEVDQKQGLHMPIMIFGFTKMRRGVSYRSNQRVPTHLVISLGRGHNAMNVIQAMGRATFKGKTRVVVIALIYVVRILINNFLHLLAPFLPSCLLTVLPPGKSLLKSNGFDNVTLLTTYTDYKMACKAINFMDIFQKRVRAGQTFSEAICGAEQIFPDAANFLRHTDREIGQLKGQRNELEDIAEFDEPNSLTPEEEKMKRQYLENDELQRVLRALLDHASKNIKETFGIDDIREDYNDTYTYDKKTITKKKLNAYMRSLSDDGLIQKKGKEAGQRGRILDEYHVQSLSHLEKFIKEDKAYPHATEDCESTGSEESTTSEEATPVSFDATYCRNYFQLTHAVNLF
eukprot:scaffold89047_cov44-Attheya_sp.AAC.1